MSPHDPRIDRLFGGDGEPASQPWAAVAGRLPRPRVSEFDVARLRARVRGAVAEVEARRGVGLLRWATLAASGVLGTLLLTAVWLGGSVQDSVAKVTQIRVERLADGSVVIDFAERSRVHRVVQSTDPRGGMGMQAQLIDQGRYVDRSETVQPGSVVFYRID